MQSKHSASISSNHRKAHLLGPARGLDLESVSAWGWELVSAEGKVLELVMELVRSH
jgi:hypothetical protein